MADPTSRAGRTLAAALLLACLSATGSCSSNAPAGSLEGLKDDQRWALVHDCRLEPERFGFPYTRREYMRWQRDVGNWMPDLNTYCLAAARRLVR